MTTPSEPSHKSAAKSKPKMWYPHDGYAHLDPKLIALQRSGGYQYVGIWWTFVEVLRTTEGYRIASSSIEDIMYSLRVEPVEAEAFCQKCCELGLLVEADGFIYSPALTARMEEYDAKCETNRANAQRRKAVVERPQSDGKATAKGAPSVPFYSYSNLVSSDLKGSAEGKDATRLDPGNLPEVKSPPPVPPNGWVDPKYPEPPPEISELFKKPEVAKSPPELRDSPPDRMAKFTSYAKSHLEEADGTKDWEKTNVFMLTGRRPLKKHPEIFFTEEELGATFEQFDRAGLKTEDFRDALSAASLEINARKATGRPVMPERIPSWIANYIMENILSKKIKVNRLKEIEERKR